MQPRRAAILAVLAATQLMGVLDFAIVNLALPSIERHFDLTPGSIVRLAAGYGLAGVGIVGSVVATTIAATSALDRNRQGLAAGLLTTSQQVGGALGAAMAGVIDAPARLSSYEVSLVVAAGVVGAAMVVAVTSLRATAGRPAEAGNAGGRAA